MSSARQSLIVVGSVNGPVNIRALQNSVVVAAAKQVRVFGCKDVDLYLHTGSGPVIEESTGVRVAPIVKTFVSSVAT